MRDFLANAIAVTGGGVVGCLALALAIGAAYGIWVLLAKVALWGLAFFWPSIPTSWLAAFKLGAVLFVVETIFSHKGTK